MYIEVCYDFIDRGKFLKVFRNVPLSELPPRERWKDFWGSDLGTPSEVNDIISRANFLSTYLVKKYITYKGFPKIPQPQSSLIKSLHWTELSYPDPRNLDIFRVGYEVVSYKVNLDKDGLKEEILKEASEMITSSKCYDMYSTYFEYYRFSLLGFLHDPAFVTERYRNLVEACIASDSSKYFNEVCDNLFGEE